MPCFLYKKSIIVVTERNNSNRKVAKHEHRSILPSFHTDKEDQLNSLETQKEFFLEYTKLTGDNLIKLYADEGISGTKIKNRKEFQRMLADAEKGRVPNIVYGYDKTIGDYFNLSINEEEAKVIRQRIKFKKFLVDNSINMFYSDKEF